MDETNEAKNSDFSDKKVLIDKLRENPWILSTFVFGVMAVVLLIATLPASLSGNVISEDIAAQKIVDILKQTGLDVGLVNVSEKSGVYEIIFIVEGEEQIAYVTKDGLMAGSLFSLEKSFDYVNVGNLSN